MSDKPPIRCRACGRMYIEHRIDGHLIAAFGKPEDCPGYTPPECSLPAPHSLDGLSPEMVEGLDAMRNAIDLIAERVTKLEGVLHEVSTATQYPAFDERKLREILARYGFK